MKTILLFIALITVTQTVHHIGVSVIPGSASHHFFYRKILSAAQKTGRYKFHLLIHNHDLNHWDAEEFAIFPFGNVEHHIKVFQKALEKVQQDPIFGVLGFHETMLSLNEEVIASGFKDYAIEHKLEAFITDFPNNIPKFIHSIIGLELVFHVLPACIHTSYNTEFYVNGSITPYINSPLPFEMTFLERVWNTIQLHASMGLYKYFSYNESQLFAKYGYDTGDSYVTPNTVVMGQCIDGIHFPYERPPNFRDIGAVLVKEPKEIEKEDILQFIMQWDKVIYMSQGTIMDILDLNNLKDIFQSFPEYGFIFSERNVDLSFNFGNNVLPLKWAPQNDILGHPRVIAFITHGGLNSFYEGIYNQKPMLVLGMAIDQLNNAGITIYREIGVVITSRSELNVENMTRSLKELLENPKYLTKVRELSKVLKRNSKGDEQFIAQLDEAFEIGVGHLQLEGMKRNLGIWRTFGKDITLFAFIILYVLLWKILLLLRRRFFPSC